MNLTDNGKLDAIKLIQEGRPLPEKYRFLLAYIEIKPIVKVVDIGIEVRG